MYSSFSLTENSIKKKISEWSLITLGSLFVIAGSYFFKFPNHFSFGGITGLSVVVAAKTNISPSQINMVCNAVLLAMGFIFLGRDFGIKTIYATVLITAGMSILDKVYPHNVPYTPEKLMELIYAVVLPGIGSAILFYCEASSGGTDIIAMIIKKHTSVNIGNALVMSDILITLSALFVFNVPIFLYSLMGMMCKSLVIDNLIKSLNNSKVINVICSNPEPVYHYILNGLHRGATLLDGQGAYTGQERYIIISVMKRKEAFKLKRFLHQFKIDAFITMTNTSEIYGNGFGKY